MAEANTPDVTPLSEPHPPSIEGRDEARTDRDDSNHRDNWRTRLRHRDPRDG